MRPVVTFPGPTPGIPCTAAITPRKPLDTARSAAPRVLRSMLTEKPSPAVSFGTLSVALAVTGDSSFLCVGRRRRQQRQRQEGDQDRDSRA